jgi:hypothetical protein
VVYQLDFASTDCEGTHSFESVIWNREDLAFPMMPHYLRRVVRVKPSKHSSNSGTPMLKLSRSVVPLQIVYVPEVGPVISAATL